jgi:Mn-dependent DtxR family transcriptional regulator
VETLQKLTRRQVDALAVVLARESAERGVSLNAIASALTITPPSALGHLTVLEDEGLVVRHRGKSRVTPKGRRTMAEYQRHHRVAESMFSRLGMSPDETCAAAREVDLSISHRTIEQVCAAEGHPEVCPHGRPITPCTTKKGGA